MKKLIYILIIGYISLLNANVKAVVSILPQELFVKSIGGDKVDVSLMVKPGNSPHTYEPKPSQMRYISQADIYFAIDVEFEHVWLKKFINQNQDMQVVDLSDGIKKIEIQKNFEEHESDHEDEHHEGHDHHKHEGLDPHIWTTPSNVKIIAKNILNSLVKIDSKNKEYYEQNYKKFLEHIEQTDSKIKTILKNIPKKSKFMVFHPSWQYFAKEYSLVQLPIEIEGKSPKPKALVKLIKVAKQYKVKAIFTQPEFSPKIANTIAKQLNIDVIKTSPLNKYWSENLIKLAQAIASHNKN